MPYLWQNKPPEVPYEHQEYPKWVGETVVQNADEEAALLKASRKQKRTEADPQ